MQNLVIYSGSTIRTQSAFYGSQGEGKVGLVDLRDVAAVAVKVLTEDGHLGKAYALTGPHALTAAQVARTLSSAVGREIKYVDLPPDQMKQALLSAGVPEFIAEGDVDLNQLYRSGGASLVSPDIEHILGRQPISLEQFARDYAGAFASSGAAAR